MMPELALAGLHLVSMHGNAEMPVNNRNIGLYAETVDGWAGGFYRNSFDRTTVYAGHSFRWTPPSVPVRLVLTLGVASGYQHERVDAPCATVNSTLGTNYTGKCWFDRGWSRGALTLMAAPSLELGPVRLWYVPAVGRSGSVYHLSTQWRFK